jgi:hypothetical protein
MIDMSAHRAPGQPPCPDRRRDVIDDRDRGIAARTRRATDGKIGLSMITGISGEGRVADAVSRIRRSIGIVLQPPPVP